MFLVIFNQFLQDLGTKFTPDNKITMEKSDLVILAVKPKIIPFVLDDVYPYVKEHHLILSFAAGVNISSIEKVITLYTFY